MNRVCRIIFLFLLAVVSCRHRVTQEELIQDAVALKLEQWRLSELTSCHDRAIAKAEAYVDSFLLVNSIHTLDTIPKPPKPVKPEKPVFKSKPDTLKVDPLFRKEEE